MHRSLAPSLTFWLISGCYTSQMHDVDTGPRPDVYVSVPDATWPEDASIPQDAPSTDAAVTPFACTSLRASPGVQLSLFAPLGSTNFTLGGAEVTGATTALVAFSGSNNDVEMEVARWVLPIDLDTAEPLRDRVPVLGRAPLGSGIEVTARLVRTPHSMFAFASDRGTCVRQFVGPLGEVFDPEAREEGPCPSANVTHEEAIAYFRREGDARAAGYFETVDDDGVRTSISSLGPSALELPDTAFTWAYAVDGTLTLLATDATGTRFGTWPALDWREVEGAGPGSALRLVSVGDRLLGAWIDERSQIALAFADDAQLHLPGIEANRAGSIDVMPRGDELWLAYVAGDFHGDARATIARLSLALEEQGRRTEVGVESFVTALRLVPSMRGALLIAEGQRRDVGGGRNIFGIPIACTDAAEGPSGCARWHVTIDHCADTCDAEPTYVWDGARCAPVQCNCVGEDCAAAYAVEADCVRDHILCASTRCEATGGVWLADNRQYCSAPVCGRDLTECTDRPDALCHCGLGSLYSARFGCFQSCAGGGDTDQLRCERSGGSWGPNCAHSHCGESPDCAALACRCDDDEVWSDIAGCVVSEECTFCAGG